MIDLINLREHHCRYIVEGAFFCGKRRRPGTCCEHGKLVFTPSRPRDKDRRAVARFKEAKRDAG